MEKGKYSVRESNIQTFRNILFLSEFVLKISDESLQLLAKVYNTSGEPH